MRIREELKNTYYLEWNQKYNFCNKSDALITDEFLIEMYNEYIIKLEEFIDDLDKIKIHIKKEEFKPNYRQVGSYKRCVTNYPDKGWNKKYEQYSQAYKELMVDFLCYPDLDYDELSIKEINILKEMALFLIKEAKVNINELR